MTADRHQLTQLDSGLRIVTERMESVRSVAIGFWIAAGSRYETTAEAGLSHFVEHLLFKGTERYDSHEIDEIFDELGAELNAGTGKETTSLYARVRDEHVDRAIDVMADMVWRPAMTDVDNERAVVLEEIAMYEDDPQDKVFDLLGEAVFGDDPLGRATIGRAPVIADTPPEDIAAFHAERYGPANVVVSAAGSVDHDVLVALVEEAARGRDGGVHPEASHPGGATARVRFVRKDTEQYHVCLGAPGLARDDERRFALRVLDAILGGTSSSRLFRQVREERGLAYSVYSFASFFADTGQVGLYIGTRADNLGEGLSVVADELHRLLEDPASEAELRRFQESLKGRAVLALESTAARMNRLGSSVLGEVPLLSLEEVMARIDAVTIDDLRELAHELWTPDRLSAAGIGPDAEALRIALSPFGSRLAEAV